jgi:hypothetical protein
VNAMMVSGRPATVAYVLRDFTPADKTNWELAKVLFDDGEMVLLANEPAPASAAFNFPTRAGAPSGCSSASPMDGGISDSVRGSREVGVSATVRCS